MCGDLYRYNHGGAGRKRAALPVAESQFANKFHQLFMVRGVKLLQPWPPLAANRVGYLHRYPLDVVIIILLYLGSGKTIRYARNHFSVTLEL